MDNVSALSVYTAPQGRAGPGTWGQSSDGGFIDFITAVMGQSETPAARVGPMKNAEPAAAMWTPQRAANTDKDVENVVPPQLVGSREDLLQLIALLTGEEDNDGFLYALDQYIRQYFPEKPEFTAIITVFPAAAKETKLFDLLALLGRLLRKIDEDELPPELAPLTNLFAMFAPVTEEPMEAAAGVETSFAAPAETAEIPEAAEAAEVPKGEEAVPAAAREIPDTVRVTELKIAPQRRVAYNPFAAIRAAAVTAVHTPAAAAVQEEKAEGAEAEEKTAVWDLTEPTEEVAVFEKPAAEAKPIVEENAGTEDVKAAAPPVPQIEAPRQAAQPVETTETAPARQIVAERIIGQITAQASKAQDVSVLQMELHPKFLGKIQLVIEATAQGMTAKLRSDNGAVRSLLNEHIADLKASLKEAGISMKDIEVTESRIGAHLANRDPRQDGAEEAKEGPAKIKGLTAVTAADGAESTGQPAAYTLGRVSGDSQFDYRA